MTDRTLRDGALTDDADADPLGPGTYFTRTRRPVMALAFLAPLLAAYELGAVWLAATGAGDAGGGADGLLRGLLAPLGPGVGPALPLVVAAVLLGWNFYGQFRWSVDGETLAGMLGESLLFASLLVGAAYGVRAVLPGGGETLAAAEVGSRLDPPPAVVRAVGAVGAGVYEELLFRLCALPLAYGGFRLLRCGPRGAAVLAVAATSLLFALCHHLGAGAEVPRWGPFAFRTVAGAVLAGLFWVRGFGVAAGTHASFNLFAGVLLAE